MKDKLAARIAQHQHPVCHDRRRWLQLALGSSVSLAFMPKAYANLAKLPERKLSLHNLHTGESLKTTYWAEGHYQPDELKAIHHILRDHRTNEVAEIDSDLLDLMNILHHRMQGKQPYHIISGYRSPTTNENLRKTSSGVARLSYHTLGKAVDFRLPGKELSALHKAALALEAGGVGYYPRSDFIHLDTGPLRQWQG